MPIPLAPPPLHRSSDQKWPSRREITSKSLSFEASCTWRADSPMPPTHSTRQEQQKQLDSTSCPANLARILPFPTMNRTCKKNVFICFNANCIGGVAHVIRVSKSIGRGIPTIVAAVATALPAHHQCSPFLLLPRYISSPFEAVVVSAAEAAPCSRLSQELQRWLNKYQRGKDRLVSIPLYLIGFEVTWLWGDFREKGQQR